MITPSLCYVHFLPVPWNHSLPPEPHHSNCMRGQDVQSVTGWRVDWLHMQLSFGLRSGHRLQNSVLCVITIGPGAGLVPWLTRAPPYCGLLLAKLVHWPGHFPALHGSPHAKAWSPVYWISPSKGLHSSSSPASLTFYCLKVRGINHSSNHLEVLSQLAAKWKQYSMKCDNYPTTQYSTARELSKEIFRHMNNLSYFYNYIPECVLRQTTQLHILLLLLIKWRT